MVSKYSMFLLLSCRSNFEGAFFFFFLLYLTCIVYWKKNQHKGTEHKSGLGLRNNAQTTAHSALWQWAPVLLGPPRSSSFLLCPPLSSSLLSPPVHCPAQTGLPWSPDSLMLLCEFGSVLFLEPAWREKSGEQREGRGLGKDWHTSNDAQVGFANI